ncbi:MAG: hypothetical protein WC712_03635 [Candidatus Brocadiia bacterium]
MRILRRYSAALLLLTILLLSGCTTAEIGAVRSISPSPDGWVAVVHAVGTQLLLRCSDPAGTVRARWVAGPAAVWHKGSLLCEIFFEGRRTLAVFNPGDLDNPLYVSGKTTCGVFPGTPPSFIAVLNNKRIAFELPFDDPKSPREQEIAGAPTDVLSIASVEGGVRLFVTEEGGVPTEAAIDRTFDHIGLGRPISSFYMIDAQSDGEVGGSNVSAGLWLRAEGCEPVRLLSELEWGPRSSVIPEGLGEYFCVEGARTRNFFRLRFSASGEGDKRKLKASASSVDPPELDTIGVFPLGRGFGLVGKTGVSRWECKGKPESYFRAYPFRFGPVAAQMGETTFASLCAADRPARLAVSFSAGKMGLLVLDRLSISEWRGYSNSMRVFSMEMSIPDTQVPVDVSGLTKAEPVEFLSPTGCMPAAEYALAKGEVEKAISMYSQFQDKYPLRLAELSLFESEDRDEGVKWLAKVSDAESRKRVDLYLDVLSERRSALRESYFRAFKAARKGDFDSLLDETAYFRKAGKELYDPLLFSSAIDYAQYIGDKKGARQLIDRTIEIALDSRFAREAKLLAGRALIELGDCERGSSLLMEVCTTPDNPDLVQCSVLVNGALETGKGLEAARTALDFSLKMNRPVEDAIRDRIRRMVIAAFLQRDSAVALGDANVLSWGAYEDSATALEAGIWSVLSADCFSRVDGNQVLKRFCANPRICLRAVVPDIARCAFRNAVVALPDDAYGPEGKLPDEFRARVALIAELPELAASLPTDAIAFLAGGEYDDARLLDFLSQRQPLALWEDMRVFVAILASADERLSDKIAGRSIPLDLPLPFLGSPQVISVQHSMSGLSELLRKERRLSALVVHMILDPRLDSSIMGLYSVSGKAISNALGERWKWKPAVYPPSSESGVFAAAVWSPSVRTLFTLLQSYPEATWSAPFWRAIRILETIRGQPASVLDVSSGISAGEPSVAAAILDARCFCLLALGKSAELRLECARLLATKSSTEFSRGSVFAQALADLAQADARAQDEAAWRLEWLKRGGLALLPEEKVLVFLSTRQDLVEQWATESTDEVAMFVLSLPKGTASALLEACGKARGAVEKAIMEIQPPAPPEDAQDKEAPPNGE